MRTARGGRDLVWTSCIATAIACLPLSTGCRGANPSQASAHLAPVRPSSFLAGDPGRAAVPIPADPSAAAGQNQAEMLAFVEGEYITRGKLMRVIGPKTSTEDDAEYEKGIYRELKRRVQSRVFVEAAHRMGLQVPPDVLDRIVAEQIKKEEEDASKKVGRPVKHAEIRAQKGQSLEEFRAGISDEVLKFNYLRAVREGLPGKRPQIDLEPSPADLRRVYNSHRATFDVQAGAKVAWWKIQAVDYLDDGKRTYEEAVAEAKRRSSAVVAAVRAGSTPDAIDQAQGFKPGPGIIETDILSREEFDHGITRFDDWQSDPAKLKAIEDWIYDGSRRAPDAAEFETPGGGLAVVAVLVVREAKVLPFQEVQEKVATLIKGVRSDRVTMQHFLELMQHATIWPARLAAEMEADTRKALKDIDANPVLKDVWLR